MSKLGKIPLSIPEGVTINESGGEIVITGTKGELKLKIPANIEIQTKEGKMKAKAKDSTKKASEMLGLFISMLKNNIVGVSKGWTKTLVLVGTGYRARVEGETLILNVGYSHTVNIHTPEGITFSVEENKIKITGPNKELVGQLAANIRSIRPPEPYKGKGIRYEDEQVRRKAGKSAKTGTKA